MTVGLNCELREICNSGPDVLFIIRILPIDIL